MLHWRKPRSTISACTAYESPAMNDGRKRIPALPRRFGHLSGSSEASEKTTFCLESSFTSYGL